ncbi:hypothetical protein D9X30_3444 [Cupriavidus sp. U2]|uniref:hypothetical protein n=1 Tax=Cupriavidus sp. U2 TaxID=2920269 RepID=UPI00129EC919|nr:hypothetical protein [Cupriavidus sp. U2]KAI3591619.1 hypothetical protein D9X30_3444 [Cupriavidus sp. U2]
MTTNDARGALTEVAKSAWDEAWQLAFNDGLGAGHPLGRSFLDRETEWKQSDVLESINRQKDNESTAITGDGMAPTDEQILAIGRQHFRPGHDPKAEPAFIAAVRAILAASAQGSNDARDVKRLDFLLEDGAIIDTITNGEGEKRYHLYWPGFDESQRAWYCTPRAAIDAQMAAISTAPNTEIEALFEGRAENTAVISANSAVNSGGEVGA